MERIKNIHVGLFVEKRVIESKKKIEEGLEGKLNGKHD